MGFPDVKVRLLRSSFSLPLSCFFSSSHFTWGMEEARGEGLGRMQWRVNEQSRGKLSLSATYHPPPKSLLMAGVWVWESVWVSVWKWSSAAHIQEDTFYFGHTLIKTVLFIQEIIGLQFFVEFPHRWNYIVPATCAPWGAIVHIYNLASLQWICFIYTNALFSCMYIQFCTIYSYEYCKMMK